MSDNKTTRHPRALVCATAVLALLLAACGGGSGTDAPSFSTTVPGGPGTGSGNGSGGGGAGDTGMVLPPFDASVLNGGVLATFAVGQEKFRGWFTSAANAQLLVDAFAGTGAPITSICARLRLGAGAQGHNAPWTWSVDTLLPTSFNNACANCPTPYTAPSEADAAANTPAWLNCTFMSGNAVGIEARAFMQVTLLDVVDRR